MLYSHSSGAPNVYRLEQRTGLVLVQTLPSPACQWPLTLGDCEAALIRLLPQARADRQVAPSYWHWVARTRAELVRLYEAHRQDCRERQAWDLAGLLRLRWRVELVTLRLYCAPWLPSAQVPSLSSVALNRQTA